MWDGSYLTIQTHLMQHFLFLQSKVFFFYIYNANVRKKCIKMSDSSFSSLSITL